MTPSGSRSPQLMTPSGSRWLALVLHHHHRAVSPPPPSPRLFDLSPSPRIPIPLALLPLPGATHRPRPARSSGEGGHRRPAPLPPPGPPPRSAAPDRRRPRPPTLVPIDWRRRACSGTPKGERFRPRAGVVELTAVGWRGRFGRAPRGGGGGGRFDSGRWSVEVLFGACFGCSLSLGVRFGPGKASVAISGAVLGVIPCGFGVASFGLLGFSPFGSGSVGLYLPFLPACCWLWKLQASALSQLMKL
ncbi:hypothetical protein PVAP13_6KG108535 [Panicum virgatum]|uniref:Uncharacterized protein n=1 Tax=Panicum virgatum TaxID=38727 RepID=A0A8T0RB05_PANVG|nr:hypothetical protein PVAP13_6KG108535 [Panicum virgatum]